MKLASWTNFELPLAFVLLNNADSLIPDTAPVLQVNVCCNVDLDVPAA